MATQDVAIVDITNGQFAFYVTGSYSPADVGTTEKIGTPTDVTLTLSALANGAGRLSNKATLPAARAPLWECKIAVDFTDELPTQGGQVHVYWCPSTSVTAGTGNLLGTDGVDGAAPGNALGSATLADMQAVAQYIGSFTNHDGASVQNGPCGYLVNPSRYGQILVVNNSGDAFEADNVEMGVFLNPIMPQIQAAV